MPENMTLEPIEWNAIVVGAWNRAIFTPAWIGSHLYGLQPDTPVVVDVPLNVHAPWRVRHGHLAVIVGRELLEVAIDQFDYATLDSARLCAIRAIDELPKTPLVAGGYNVKYRIANVSPSTAALLDGPIDSCISKVKLSITERVMQRSIPFHGGVVNLVITHGERKGTVLQFNFHRETNDPEALKTWYQVPITEIEAFVAQLSQAIAGGQ